MGNDVKLGLFIRTFSHSTHPTIHLVCKELSLSLYHPLGKCCRLTMKIKKVRPEAVSFRILVNQPRVVMYRIGDWLELELVSFVPNDEEEDKRF